MTTLLDVPYITWRQTEPYHQPIAFRIHWDEGMRWITKGGDWPDKTMVSALVLDDPEPRTLRHDGSRILIRTVDEWALYRIVGRYADRYVAELICSGTHDRDIRWHDAPLNA